MNPQCLPARLKYVSSILLLGLSIQTRAQSSSLGNLFVHAQGSVAIHNLHTFRNGATGALPGIIGTERVGANSFVCFVGSASSADASDATHIDGYVLKYGIGAFTFPIGDNGKLRTCSISSMANATESTSAAYFKADPNTAITSNLAGGNYAALPAGAPFNTSSKAADINTVSTIEYWDIDGASAVELTLTYDATSAIATLTNNDLSKLSIAGWNGTQWVLIPSTATGTLSAGTIKTNVAITPTTYNVFTFAAEALVAEDTDGDGIANDLDLDDDNDGVLDTAECAVANRVQYVDFAGWPGLTSIRAVPYPGGGNVTVNTVKSYKLNGVPTTYNHSNGDLGAGVMFPRAFEGASLANNFTGAAFRAEYAGYTGAISNTHALNLERSLAPQSAGTYEHELEIDYTTTTAGKSNGGAVLAIGGFYPDAQGWNNEITITAYKTGGVLETDYSGWKAIFSDVNTSQANGGTYSTPWESATNTPTGIVLDPSDNPAGYAGYQDTRWAQLQAPANQQYEKIVIKRKLIAAAGYYDFEYWAFAIGYEYSVTDCDADGDGLVNTLDLDSDGDGCSDAYEAGATTNTTANYQFPIAGVGTNGLANSLETVADNGVINYTSTYSNATNANIHNCPAPIQLVPKAYLSGSYDAGTGMMYDSLRVRGFLPSAQPYNSMGYAGTETVNASVLTTTGANAIVDWVLIQLRSDTSTVVAQQAALIQRDGDIVSTDGVSALTFAGVNAGNYYVVVKHRNHLGVMTANALALTSSATTVDFTIAATPNFQRGGNFGNIYAQRTIGSVRTLWSGNTGGGNTVKATGASSDAEAALFKVLLDVVNTELLPTFIVYNGYFREDGNLDGKVIYQGSGSETDMMLFNVLLHGSNISVLPNFIIYEQIP